MGYFSRQQLKQKGVLAKTKRSEYNVRDLKSVLIKESLDASESKRFDIFLSHSFLDAEEVLGLKEALSEFGYSAYVDWIEDVGLDRSNVTARTADTVRQRMKLSRSLFFIASENSKNSKWMSWELGFFDGVNGKVAVLPILNDDTAIFQRQEYLELYPYVTKDSVKNKPGEILWVNVATDEYVSFDAWLTGSKPSKRV